MLKKLATLLFLILFAMPGYGAPLTPIEGPSPAPQSNSIDDGWFFAGCVYDEDQCDDIAEMWDCDDHQVIFDSRCGLLACFVEDCD